MDKYRQDIEKYLKGEFTPAEMHTFEKQVLSDPFLTEALEGAEQLNSIDFSRDVTELNEKIVVRKTAYRTQLIRIAASVSLLAVSIFIIWIVLKQKPEQSLALLQTHAQDSVLKTQPQSSAINAESQNKKSVDSAFEAKIERKISSQKKHSKKGLPESIMENKPELAAELPTVVDTIKNNEKGVNAPARENTLEVKNNIKTISGKKDELQSPLETEVKIAEGYITSIDARPTIITGRVMSAEDGTPLPDVSVVLKGTSIMTRTDAHGQYAIMADSQNKTLVYSSEGLESTEVKIEGIDSTYLPVKIEITDKAQEESAVETSNIRDFGPRNVYTIPAHPQIGNRAFKQYLEKNHKYPKEAKDTHVEGTVVIEFKVDTTGLLSEFKIVRGIGKGCDEELIRLILQGVKWIPTTKDGIPVSDKARVRFKFELEE